MGILDDYLEFKSGQETAMQYQRWSFLTCVAAKLGRNLWLPFGEGLIYPNMYVILVGVSGTKKTTSITSAQKLLRNSGYKKFSYTKTSKQKFLIDMSKSIQHTKPDGSIDILKALEEPLEQANHESFICCDELLDFMGMGNLDFITLLTTLWDNQDAYDERLKNSEPVHLEKPTVSLLGGVTPVSFSMAVPPEIGGQGFLGRSILVYGEPTNIRVTWPKVPKRKELEYFERFFAKLGDLYGEVELTPDARKLIDSIYQAWPKQSDLRLHGYETRRLTHLIKLCIVCAAMRSIDIKEEKVYLSTEDVMKANTILAYTETTMSEGLGELGSSRFSTASQKVVEALSNANGPLNITELWSVTGKDLDSIQQLLGVLNNLFRAQKVVYDTQDKTMADAKVLLTRNPIDEKIPYTDFSKYIKEYKDKHETITVIS